MQDRWLGWDVSWRGSRFESQVERADGHLAIAVRPATSLVRRLRHGLLHRDRDGRQSGAEATVSAARLIADLTVTGINPAALYDARVSVPLAVRTRLFDDAVTADRVSGRRVYCPAMRCPFPGADPYLDRYGRAFGGRLPTVGRPRAVAVPTRTAGGRWS